MSSNNFFLFPRLTEITERFASVEAVRQRVTECATGHVLEISVRNRSNLFYYPPSITSLTSLVPRGAFRPMPHGRAKQVPFPVDLREGRCDSIPLKDHRFDCVVSTFALSTVPDLALALREIRRVLKPAGRLLFAEYGLSRDVAVAEWQRRMKWIIRTFNGAIAPLEFIDDALTANGFVVRSSACNYLPRLPQALGCIYEGMASNEA